MSLVNQENVLEFDWRPGVKAKELAGRALGAGDATLFYNELEAGIAIPAHVHTTDEVIVLLEGAIEAREGDETHRAQGAHTWLIPAGTPHSFTVNERASIYVFFSMVDPFAEGRTRYLEGQPPSVPSQRTTG